MINRKNILVLFFTGILSVFYACGGIHKEDGSERMKVENVPEGMYTTFLADKPVIDKDVTYDEGKNLKLDVYYLEMDKVLTDKRAAVVLMHGGGFVKGDKDTDELTKAFAVDLSRMGYVVFNVNYSLAKKADNNAIKNACSDIETAFTWIQKNCGKYYADPEHIALGGYSAGALLAIDVVYSNKYSLPSNDLFAVIDIAGGMLTFGKVSLANPKCLILHGDSDTTVSLKDSREFEEKLGKAGVGVMFHLMKDIGHTLITRFDEMRNVTSEFLYRELTGRDTEIELQSDTNPEYKKVSERQKNGTEYLVRQVNCNMDGDLSEWSGFEKINLDKLKDAGNVLPGQEDFSGFAYVGWNKERPDKIYIAAQIKDNSISVSNNKNSKWYNDDCLEIIFDTSDDDTLEQLMKWVVSADGNKLSVLANTENTVVATKRSGNIATYEIEIYLNRVGEQVRNNKQDIVLTDGLIMGFSIAYNDSENGERKYQIGWTKGASSDRKLLGNLRMISQ